MIARRPTTPPRPRCTSIAALAALALLALAAGPAVAPGAAADTVIELHGPGELPPRFASPAATSATAPALVRAASQTPGSVWVIPFFEVNTVDPTAEVGLMSIRAEEGANPEIEFYTATDFVYSKFVPLAAKEMFTANLRDQLVGQPGIPNGVVTGWVGVISLAPTTVDSFQVYPGDAFATGSNAFKFEELCGEWRVRFLIGGGFSGGTQLNFFALSPAGDDTGSDPPTFEGDVYDEGGTFINSFTIHTDANTALYPASSLVVPGTNFGSIDVRVLTSNGGYASATHDASGLYSVGLKGFCLDSDTSP